MSLAYMICKCKYTVISFLVSISSDQNGLIILFTHYGMITGTFKWKLHNKKLKSCWVIKQSHSSVNDWSKPGLYVSERIVASAGGHSWKCRDNFLIKIIFIYVDKSGKYKTHIKDISIYHDIWLIFAKRWIYDITGN
jgi:hypothetical protein